MRLILIFVSWYEASDELSVVSDEPLEVLEGSSGVLDELFEVWNELSGADVSSQSLDVSAFRDVLSVADSSLGVLGGGF